MDKDITALLDEVKRTQLLLNKAQDDYNNAKNDLASSPLLLELGLQVITDEKRKKRFVSEETKQKMKLAWQRRMKKKK